MPARPERLVKVSIQFAVAAEIQRETAAVPVRAATQLQHSRVEIAHNELQLSGFRVSLSRADTNPKINNVIIVNVVRRIGERNFPSSPSRQITHSARAEPHKREEIAREIA